MPFMSPMESSCCGMLPPVHVLAEQDIGLPMSELEKVELRPAKKKWRMLGDEVDPDDDDLEVPESASRQAIRKSQKDQNPQLSYADKVFRFAVAVRKNVVSCTDTNMRRKCLDILSDSSTDPPVFLMDGVSDPGPRILELTQRTLSATSSCKPAHRQDKVEPLPQSQTERPAVSVAEKPSGPTLKRKRVKKTTSQLL